MCWLCWLIYQSPFLLISKQRTCTSARLRCPVPLRICSSTWNVHHDTLNTRPWPMEGHDADFNHCHHYRVLFTAMPMFRMPIRTKPANSHSMSLFQLHRWLFVVASKLLPRIQSQHHELFLQQDTPYCNTHNILAEVCFIAHLR